MRFDGRPELLFCVPGAELDARVVLPTSFTPYHSEENTL